MSAAAAPTIEDAVAAAPAAKAPRGKKKLLMMVAALLVVLLAAGGGAVWYLKHRAAAAAAAAEAEDGDAPVVAKAGHDDAEHKGGKIDPAHPPTFLPLDPFVVNLADKDAERFAQIGITLEVESAGFADQAKAYMPAIRNSILMILAHKNSQELLGREGKEQLAEEIRRETVRPMGIDIPAPAMEVHKEAGNAAAGASQPRRLAKLPAGPPNPVRHVHFSSFIIQ